MKKFLFLLLIGFLTFLFVAIGVEFYQGKVVNNKYSYKYYFMENKSFEIKTLLLGNSFMENSINPSLIGDSVFDLAIPGRWIYYDSKLLEKYISKMVNLKHVIFGMGYAVPFFESYHFPEINKSIADHEKFKYEKFMRIKYDKPPYYYWFGLLKGYIKMTTLRNGDGFIYQDSLNYIGYESLVGHQSSNWKNQQNTDPQIILNPHSHEQIREYTIYLKEIARLCHQNKVRFIVVTPPCHDSHNMNVRQEGLDILHGMIEEVRAEYPIEYIDYLEDKEFRADSIYYNCSHLNSIGADMFALRVKKDFGL